MIASTEIHKKEPVESLVIVKQSDKKDILLSLILILFSCCMLQ